MLRNREFRRCIGAMLLAGAVALPVCLWLDKKAGILAFALFVVLLLLFYRFTQRRYRQISGLSQQLAQISAGIYTIDIGECAEGELSILSSEIYKITSALSHHAQRMQTEKTFLADALADISHQLKTPLTAMSMQIDLMETPCLPREKQAEFLRGLRLGIDRVNWLVAALLRLSRLDAGAVVFQKRPIVLQDCVRDAVEAVQIAAELKGVTVTQDMDIPVTVRTDPQWLGEAIGNIIKNCVEHTPEGGSIRICCTGNPLYAEIRIADDGPGMPKEELPHIFERFYRGQNASRDSVGIGLALSKSIIQNLGGSVTARNRRSGGMEFVIKLHEKTAV